MNKEYLARAMVVLLVVLAALIPLGGRWLANRAQPKAIEMHARIAESGGWNPAALTAQVGETIRLRLTSDDVLHGFAIGQSDQPAVDIIPGEWSETSLTFDKPGKYTYYCTRWCGANHWRMRGTIEVTGAGRPEPTQAQPLFLKLGIDVDSPQAAEKIPLKAASPEHGQQLAGQLPGYAFDGLTYLTFSPWQMWQKLRAEPGLSSLSDMDLWDAVAWVWQANTTPEALADGQALYAQNCAACHGEAGQGDGVMVEGLPRWQPGMPMPGDESHRAAPSAGRFSPPDFTDPANLLGASPALLEGKIIRGGMGTGMPYWGPIFTPDQIDALISYLYSFAWKSAD